LSRNGDDLLLLSHEDFLSLPLDTIASCSQQEYFFIYERLLYLESQSLNPNFQGCSDLSLGQLRKMDVRALFQTLPQKYNSCLGMLSTAQLSDLSICDDLLNKTTTTLLLPKNGYTHYRLSQMGTPVIFPYLKHMPIEIFRYLPIECFSLPDFPWENVTNTHDVQLFLATSRNHTSYFPENDAEFTRKVLKVMLLAPLHQLAPFFSPEHLPLFPPETLKSDTFPWADFVKKKGVIEALRFLPPKLLAETHIPWAKLVTQQDAIRSLFAVDTSISGHHSEANNVFTKNVFQHLSIENIVALASALSPLHLPLFPPETLNNKDFPWAVFVKKKDIIEGLRRLPSMPLAKTTILWKELSTQPNTVRSLFQVDRGKSGDHLESNALFTHNVLYHLSIEDITSLAPGLSFEHLLFFSAPVLRYKGFPWATFVNKSDVGKGLHLLSSVFLLSTHLPWKELAKKPDEVRELLDSRPGRSGEEAENHNLFTTNLLQGLSQENFEAFVPHLTVEHLRLLGDECLNRLPWNKFPDKEGAKEFLRQRMRT
jgi:hypothetical protein